MFRLPKKIKVPVVLSIAGGLTFAFAGTALAAPPGGTTQNSAGEAGYYVQEWNNWHVRDAHATFKITAAMEAMGGPITEGSSTDVSAVGTELCNPNNNNAAQLGLTFLNGSFQLLAKYGQFTGNITNQDPCVQAGVLPTADSSGEAAVQLAGTNASFAANDSSPVEIGSTGVWVVPGNTTTPSADTTPLVVGDTVTTDTYYSPTSHWVQFTVDIYNTTGGFVTERAFAQHIGFQNFYEGGIGVNNTTAPTLTAGATNPLVDFSDATFTNYNKSAVNKLAGGWDLVAAQTVNSGDQVTMTPTVPVGNTFNVLVGSESS
jgi:hypothetical protein